MTDSPAIDPARQLVAAKIEELGLDYSDVSRRMGMNQTYIQQYLKKGSPKWLPEGEPRRKLADMLKIEERLLRRPEPGEFPSGRAVQNSPLFRSMSPALSGPTERIPVYGTAAGGPDDEVEWNGDVVDYKARPDALQNVPEAYAVYVHGDSMEPRYRSGELVYVHPGRPVGPGAYVIVQLGEPAEPHGPTKRAIVKEYVRRTSTKLILSQLNPAKRLEIELPRVKSIHRIVAGSEP